MASWLPERTRPGLLVVGTDTGVGKTVASCAIAWALRKQVSDWRIGVCKPMSSGCRSEREGLVNEDAEALAHFADCRLPLDVINPVRFKRPLAPGVAAAELGEPIDWPEVGRSLRRVDEASDAVLVEGVGGLLVPLDPDDPRRTVLTLAVELGYPVLVVARSVLGTLNHTAMTVRLLREAGCVVAGVVMNGFDADARAAADDPSIATNRQWIEKMSAVKVLAVLPRVKPQQAQPGRARLDAGILEAAQTVYWPDVLRRPGGRSPRP